MKQFKLVCSLNSDQSNVVGVTGVTGRARDGAKLPSQVIYGGKTNRCDAPRFYFSTPEILINTLTDNHSVARRSNH